MKTLLIYSPKGGSGKSTLARNLAVAATLEGLSVATLDTDPQKSLSEWWDRRDPKRPAIQHFTVPIQEVTSAPDAMDGVDLLVIDTPTAVEVYPTAIKAMLMGADLILVPAKATIDDVTSTERAMRFARGFGRPTAFVLNQIKPRILEVRDARRRLAGVAEVCPVDIPELAEFYRAAAHGLGVMELADSKASPDIRALWRFSANRLGIPVKETA
jgi:chromosome partitioning protein